MSLLRATPDLSLQATAEQEVFHRERALDAAEAKLTGACFGANRDAVEHYRQVLDRAVAAYEDAVRRACRIERDTSYDAPGSYS